MGNTYFRVYRNLSVPAVSRTIYTRITKELSQPSFSMKFVYNNYHENTRNTKELFEVETPRKYPNKKYKANTCIENTVCIF